MSADQQSSNKGEFTAADLHNIDCYFSQGFMSEQSEQFIRVDFCGTFRIKAKHLFFRNKKKTEIITGERYIALSEDEQEDFDQIDVLDGMISVVDLGEDGESFALNHAKFEIE